MKRTGFTRWHFLGGIVLLMAAAGVLLPFFARSRNNDRPRSCQQNLRAIGLAMKQYLSDYDEAYPPVATLNASTFGWADVLHPYLRSTELFQCPSEITADVPATDGKFGGYTDYWFNASLAGLHESQIQRVDLTLMLGDGNDGHELTDARYVKYSLSPDWYKDKTKPSFRHLDGANYTLAEGQVQWLRPHQVTTNPPRKGNATFLPK